MKRFISIIILIFALAACSDGPVNSTMEPDPVQQIVSVDGSDYTSYQVSNSTVIDDFNGPTGSWKQWYPSLYVYQEDATVLGGARELRSYRDAITRIDGVSGTLEWGGNGVSSEYALRYGSLIGSNFHSTKGANPNAGKGTELNLDLGLEGEIILQVGHVSATNPNIMIILQSSSGGLYWASATLSQGEVRVPISSFTVYHGSDPMPEAAAADIDGILLDGFAHHDAGTAGTGTVFEQIAVSAGGSNEVTVFTSDPSVVDSWGPILVAPLLSPWEQACTLTPSVGLDDPRWGSPQASYEVGPAAFETWTPWADFDAPWINAWNSLFASDAPGAQYGDGTQNWAKFATVVSGDGDFVVQFLADNCSWIYLDGTLIGVQGDDWHSNPDVNGRYSLTLNGTHTLSFIVFDGGGQAGGKFRLETFESFEDGGGDLGDINPPVDPEPENNAPVADAGSDQTITATGPTTSIALNGSGSSDPDGDTLTYSWTLDDIEVATSATVSVDLTKGSYTYTLTVSDGEFSDSDEVTVTVENAIPVADAGSDQTLEATGFTTPVTLNGSGSNDVDGDEITYAWSTGDTTVSPSVNLGVGVHTITLTVTDEEGATASDEVTITITDTTAPVLSFNQVIGNLWPPNHKMVLVVTGISGTDIVNGTTDVTVTVESSQPANGKGDGNTDTDYEIVTKSDGSIDVYVRSERSGKGNSGRTYTISMSTTDSEGNISAESTTVTVAQNQGRGR